LGADRAASGCLGEVDGRQGRRRALLESNAIAG